MPLRDAEWHSLRVPLGDLAGRCVLDLACDEDGHAPHQAAGAAHVVGIDILAQMIALARQREDAEPMGIETRGRGNPAGFAG